MNKIITPPKKMEIDIANCKICLESPWKDENTVFSQCFCREACIADRNECDSIMNDLTNNS